MSKARLKRRFSARYSATHMSARNYHWHRPPSSYQRASESRLGYYVSLALIVSLAAHVVLWFLLNHKKWSQPERLVLTEKFRIQQRGTYDPKILQGLDKSDPKKSSPKKPSETAKKSQRPVPAAGDAEQASALAAASKLRPEDFLANAKNQEVRATPSVDEVENAALPAVDLSDVGELDTGAGEEVARQLLEKLQGGGHSQDPEHPSLPVDVDELGESLAGKTDLRDLAGGADTVPAGYASLDQVLGMEGKGDPGKPIWVPTDTLFDFNSADLREEAKVSLMKLGGIIMQRKDSDFILEGHTDLIGSDAYNDELSRNRAQAIRDWLVESLRLSPNRIHVRGFGKRRPKVLEGDIDAQAINRRVEVVIQPRGRQMPAEE